MVAARRVVWHGGRDLRLEEQLLPEPGPGEALVRVASCGVCMTEVHLTEGYFPPSSPPPRPIGHEFGGVVEALGPDTAGPTPGTAVACAGLGGFADAAIVPVDRLFPLPPDVPSVLACFAEPLTCCVQAVESARIPLGATVLVTGAGPMGLMMVQLVRRAGAARVLVSEPNAARRVLAGGLGADVLIDPMRERLADAVASHGGARVAFETAGRPEPLADCIDAVDEGGTVVIVGVSPESARLTVPLYRFHRRNLTLRASYGGHDFAAAVRWLGELQLAGLISHRFGLSDVSTAFETARAGGGLKVVVEAAADGKRRA